MSALSARSAALREALSARSALIPWAAQAIDVYKLISRAYQLPTGTPLEELHQKVAELETYLLIDLQRHLTVNNGRSPYYLGQLLGLLQSAVEPPRNQRQADHLCAELQTTYTEHGLCGAVDAVYEVQEAEQKMSAFMGRLDTAERSGTEEAVNALHEVLAAMRGIQQALTEAHIERLAPQFEALQSRILAVEENVCTIGSDSPVMLQYVAAQHLLATRPVIKSLKMNDSATAITSHLLHPGTRSWLLERIRRFLPSSKRLFFLSSPPGSGKSALAAAVCKLHSPQVVASHFFSANQSIDTLLISLAAELLRTLPEYLNWMDDRYPSSLPLNGQWKDTYNVLFKEPLKALDSSDGSKRQRLLVIDGPENLPPAQWDDFKALMSLMIKDLPKSSGFRFLVCTRSELISRLLPSGHEDVMEGIGLEDRAWMNRHIKDLEVYVSGSLGAILSGEDEADTPYRAKADPQTLQNTVDEILKHSGGRFDFALELMEQFASEMSRSRGQFLTSLKKVLPPFRDSHDNLDSNMRAFASPFRAYRDSEGRSVSVRVMRQNHYRMDKTRVALIRGRHRLNLDNNN